MHRRPIASAGRAHGTRHRSSSHWSLRPRPPHQPLADLVTIAPGRRWLMVRPQRKPASEYAFTWTATPARQPTRSQIGPLRGSCGCWKGWGARASVCRPHRASSPSRSRPRQADRAPFVPGGCPSGSSIGPGAEAPRQGGDHHRRATRCNPRRALFAPERRGGTNELTVSDTAVHTNRSAGRALQRRRATAMTMPTTEKKPVTPANSDNGIASPPSGTSKSTRRPGRAPRRGWSPPSLRAWQ